MKKFFNYFSNIAVNCFRNVIFQYFPTFGLPEDYRMVSRIWIRLAGQEDIVVLRNSLIVVCIFVAFMIAEVFHEFCGSISQMQRDGEIPGLSLTASIAAPIALYAELLFGELAR